MKRKGQGSGVFQLLISAVVAIAILGVLLGILNLISPPGQKVPVIARDKLSQAKTSQGTPIISEKIKVVAMICASLLTAISVSMAGMIGFIGMFVPHIVRLTCGNDHRVMIPMSTLVGGILLMVADTAIRTTTIGNSVPVGSLTALLGAPFFLWLLFRQTRPALA